MNSCLCSLDDNVTKDSFCWVKKNQMCHFWFCLICNTKQLHMSVLNPWLNVVQFMIVDNLCEIFMKSIKRTKVLSTLNHNGAQKYLKLIQEIIKCVGVI